MKILYLSCHSVLEYLEVKMFTEMGHDVFSYQGSYMDPKGHFSLPRPSIEGMTYHEEMVQVTLSNPKTKLPREVVSWADVVIIMHTPEWIVGNWTLFRELGKPVIWRSIGQSTERIERIISFYMAEGLKVVRYSPMEKHIEHYAGESDLIRFYQDPQDLNNWNGNSNEVVNFTQSLKGRRQFCHYDQIVPVVSHFNGKVFGSGNDDLGELNGGILPYDQMKQKMRDASVAIYGGTWPAPYTLSLMELMMTGTPIVSINRRMAEEIEGVPNMRFSEIEDIIENGVSGFYCNDVNEMIDTTQKLLDNKDLSQAISSGARRRAESLFGKKNIQEQWRQFLCQL